MNSRTRRRTKFQPYPDVPELAAPTFTVPPAGKCPTLSREPTLAWAFSLKFSFWFSILTSPPPRTRLRRAEFINASRRVPLQICFKNWRDPGWQFPPVRAHRAAGQSPGGAVRWGQPHALQVTHCVPLLTMPTPTPSPAVARLPALAAPSPTHRPLCHCLPALRGWQCQQGEAKLGKWREASGSREPEGQ